MNKNNSLFSKSLFIYREGSGGETIAMESLASALQAKMKTVKLKMSRDEKGGLRSFLLNLWKESIYLMRYFYRHNENYSYVITSVHSFIPSIWFMHFFYRYKLVFIYHGNRIPHDIGEVGFSATIGQKILLKLSFFLWSISMRLVDLSLLPSESALKYFRDHKMTCPNNYMILPNGVKLASFSLKKQQRNTHQTVAYFGRIDSKKGIEILIRALVYLPRKTHLLLAITSSDNDKEQKANLEKLIISYGLESRVQWFFDVKLMRKMYAKVDLVVLPSFEEVMPLVMLESAATKKLFLGYKVGEIPKFVNQVDPRMCMSPTNNPVLLANRISLLLGLSEKDKNEIINRFFTLVQSFDWDNIGVRFMQIITIL